MIIFLDQEEEELDREYGGIPKSFVYLRKTAEECEKSPKFLDWQDMDEVGYFWIVSNKKEKSVCRNKNAQLKGGVWRIFIQ